MATMTLGASHLFLVMLGQKRNQEFRKAEVGGKNQGTVRQLSDLIEAIRVQ